MIRDKTTNNWSWIKHFLIRIFTSTYRRNCFCDLLIVIAKIERIEYWRFKNSHETMIFRFLLFSSFLKINLFEITKFFPRYICYQWFSNSTYWNIYEWYEFEIRCKSMKIWNFKKSWRTYQFSNEKRKKTIKFRRNNKNIYRRIRQLFQNSLICCDYILKIFHFENDRCNWYWYDSRFC